ncbi:MAG TPA: hypothetical protein VFU46_05770 [Gemmatimonadales bacterium]|nr:hypothetical protein [Gemmatimonadales bacterium]
MPLCPLCREVIGPAEDRVVTPDFLADESDPFWPFANAAIHRPCFLVWEHRKAFVARYNRVARQLVREDGRFPFMTSEGEIVYRLPGGP